MVDSPVALALEGGQTRRDNLHLKGAQMESSSMLDRLQGRRRFRNVPDTLQIHYRLGTPGKGLLADAELTKDGLIALGIVFLQVIQQATALADQHEKAAARAVVFLVRLEVLRQLANALAKQRDLDLGTPGVGRVRAMLVNDGPFLLSG